MDDCLDPEREAGICDTGDDSVRFFNAQIYYPSTTTNIAEERG